MDVAWQFSQLGAGKPHANLPRNLGVLDVHHSRMKFAFAPHSKPAMLNIAAQMSASRKLGDVVTKRYRLEYKSIRLRPGESVSF
jgi:hypothetical protein